MRLISKPVATELTLIYLYVYVVSDNMDNIDNMHEDFQPLANTPTAQ